MNDTRNDEKNSCWGFPRDLNRETKWNSPRLPASVNMSHIMDSYSFSHGAQGFANGKHKLFIYQPPAKAIGVILLLKIKTTVADVLWEHFEFPGRDPSILDGIFVVGWIARPISNLMGKMVVWSQAGFCSTMSSYGMAGKKFCWWQPEIRRKTRKRSLSTIIY